MVFLKVWGKVYVFLKCPECIFPEGPSLVYIFLKCPECISPEGPNLQKDKYIPEEKTQYLVYFVLSDQNQDLDLATIGL